MHADFQHRENIYYDNQNDVHDCVLIDMIVFKHVICPNTSNMKG